MRFDSRYKRYRRIAVAVLCAAIGVWLLNSRPRTTSSAPSPTRNEPTSTAQKVAPAQPLADTSADPLNAQHAVRLRPLTVARQSLYFEWTAPDAMDTNVLRQIAHNELEYQRLVEETARIVRRQLVYRKQTIDALVEHARAIGVPLRQLVVPGLDGQEFVAELLEANLHPSGIEGAFAGRLAGRPDSMVTIAFKGGREAFTLISPADGIYLQGDPREPGEIIVKSIDPAKYVPGVCGIP